MRRRPWRRGARRARAEESAGRCGVVGRADHAPGNAFSVVVEDVAGVGQVHRHVVVGGETTENVGVGDAHSSFEQQVAKSQADRFTGGEVLSVGGRRQREGGERTGGDDPRRTLRNRVGVTAADVGHLLGDEVWVDCRPLTISIGPTAPTASHRPDRLGVPFDEPPQPDVGERAGNVGVHLNHGHLCASSCRATPTG